MDSSAAVRVLLYLDRDTPGVSGWLEDGSGRARPFYGWLELSALLEDARAPGKRPGSGDDGG